MQPFKSFSKWAHTVFPSPLEAQQLSKELMSTTQELVCCCNTGFLTLSLGRGGNLTGLELIFGAVMCCVALRCAVLACTEQTKRCRRRCRRRFSISALLYLLTESKFSLFSCG